MNINVNEVVCIDREKINVVVKQVNRIFNECAMTAGDVILVTEVVKLSWISSNTENELVRKYGLKKVEQ